MALNIVSPSALIRNHLTEAWRDGNSETPMLSFTSDMLGVFKEKQKVAGSNPEDGCYMFTIVEDNL